MTGVAAQPDRTEQSPADVQDVDRWRPAPVRHRLLPPSWPLTALFLGFPLWWALGLAEFIFPLMAIPMAAQLLQRRRIRAPIGFGFWLVFCVWMLAGAAMLWADAVGAAPGGGGPGRLMVFGYRAVMYLAATVFLLYVVNLTERELPTRKVVRLLGFMFVATTAGGVAGVVAPGVEFTSLTEMLLPQALSSNEFVNGLIHPATAYTTSFLGYEEARPIAPFQFANSWGANLSLYLPFFCLAWLGNTRLTGRAGWRRWLAPLVVVAAAVPIVYSLNRGVWLVLGIGAVYVTARFAFLGRVWAVQLVGIGLLIGAVSLVATPLGDLVALRLETPHSNSRRIQLATETTRSVVLGSPLLGYGSTRDVQGSFASIAGGSTPECPACGVPPLGTQGQFWMVLFSQGLIGLGLFLSFFTRQFFAHWRDPTPLAITGSCVLLFYGLQIVVYDTLGAPMVTVMITLGLMARQSMRIDTQPRPERERYQGVGEKRSEPPIEQERA